MLATLCVVWVLCYMDRMVVASAIPFVAREFHLSSLAMGSVLSAFFVGYALMQIPGGMLADRFGARRIVIVALIAWTLFTVATGLVKSLSAMLVTRAVFGLSEGLFPPAAAKAIATWFPQDEVGRANGIQLAATQIGPVLAPPFAAAVMLMWGWRWSFFSLLVPGAVLLPIVWWNLRDLPAQTQSITRGAVQNQERVLPGKVATTQLLKSPTVLWCCVALFAASLAAWGLMNWLPTYLLRARGFGVAKMGVFGALPFSAGALGYFVGGYLSDQYFSRRRQLPIILGLAGAAVWTYLAAIAPGGELAVFYLAMAFFFLCIGLSGLLTLPLVIVPAGSVGLAFGIIGMCAQLAAFVSPILVGYALVVTRGDFKIVFYCLVSLFVVASLAAAQIKARGLSESVA